MLKIKKISSASVLFLIISSVFASSIPTFNISLVKQAPTIVHNDQLIPVSYKVRNNTPFQLNGNGLIGLPHGLQQIMTDAGDCPNPFDLAPKNSSGDSCILHLLLTGDNIQGSLQVSPRVCNTHDNPIYCAEPSPSNIFTIQKVNSAQLPIYENFDSVVAPALPSGWTAITSGCGSSTHWVTSTANPDTPPNSAFINDPNCISDAILLSPSFLMPAEGAIQLTFKNNYNLESNFDGGVLEISINGGAFQDIVTAGGVFVTGGYNGTINSSHSNPLAGRRAWTGNSAGYITTTVTLPSSVLNQFIQLRWRRGTDNSLGLFGWFFDTISITFA